MKNNFYKSKVVQNKPQNKPADKKTRILAICLLGLFVFWSICSILGVIAFFRQDNTKTAHADSLNSVYRDSVNIDDSIDFFYKQFVFVGQPSGNFSSPFKISINTKLSSQLTIYLRFDSANYESPNGFNLFINGTTRTSPAFERVLLDGVTYYKCVMPYTLMNDITSLYDGTFALMSLNYQYDTPLTYKFDMFITRGLSTLYQPLYFEGFLASDNYDKGYSEALKSTDYSEFFNGYGTFTYYLGSTLYTKSFVPSENSQYFSSGMFLFSAWFLDTIGYGNLSRFTGGSLEFRFVKELTISPSYFLNTLIYGFYSFDQFVGLTLSYYNYSQDTGQKVYAGSKPQAVTNNSGDGILYTNENFYTANTINSSIVNGQVVSMYGSVGVDTLVIGINSSQIILALEIPNNTINLGFPTGFFNGYEAGLIDGRLSINSEVFFNKGYEKGKQFAEQRYKEGFTDGLNSQEYSFFGLLGAVVDAPIQAITGLFNFEVLGMNMMSFFMSILTLAIVIFVVRLML